MGPNMMSIEAGKWVVGAVPIDTTGAAVTGDYVNMKHWRKLAIVIQQGAWAGGTPAVTVKQATDAANSLSDEKAVSFTSKWSWTGLTSDTPVKATVSSDTFNLSSTANTTTVIEIDAQDLDIANGFTHVRVGIATPGSNADLICVMYYLYQAAHTSKPETMPSAIV